MKTEIFGTLGPSCDNTDLLYEMFRRGMTGMRLNLSHTSLEESRESIARFHEAARRAGCCGELLIDMQGPELRVGRLKQPVELKDGETVFLSEEAGVPVPESVLNALESGDILLFDDGRLEVKVCSCGDGSAEAAVIRGGFLSGRKSVKIVNKTVSGPVLTEQDLANIRQAKEYGVTALMQPFVHGGSQLQYVRSVLDEEGCDDIRIFAKIEDRTGMEHLDEIVPQADMIVIARGDLGNDMPLWELPAACHQIESVCRKYGKPFLMVTQMLYTMIGSPVPTRAEVSDIFHAVLEGASAVMVTNETAAGKFPAEVIRYLANTAKSAEEVRKEEEHAGQSI